MESCVRVYILHIFYVLPSCLLGYKRTLIAIKPTRCTNFSN